MPPPNPALSVRWPRQRSAGARTRRTSPASPPQPYPVLIAYASVPAARQAMARLTEILRGQREAFLLQPMLWRFDQLDDPRWREMALADAARAATLVLALGSSATVGPGGEAWLTSLAARQRGAKLTALAFIGDDEAWTISLQHTAAASTGASASQTTLRPTSPASTSRSTQPIACAA